LWPIRDNFDQRNSERDKWQQQKGFIPVTPFGRLWYCLRASKKLYEIYSEEEAILARGEVVLFVWWREVG
jgi:hypothetical protein